MASSPATAAFVAGQRAELGEVAALHAAVEIGELTATEADLRSPYRAFRGLYPHSTDV
jgi:hypothetical protein